jgi:predicted NUDIX family NTP pyrophosphohydrolase
MASLAGGLLMYTRLSTGGIAVLLAHPGGPYFRNRDEGVWTIPKGELESGEDKLTAAIREFEEEIGFRPEPEKAYFYLGESKQKGGKVNHIWALHANPDLTGLPQSNTFPMEWPPRSGQKQHFPEVDDIGFFDIQTARQKIRDRQEVFIDRLMEQLDRTGS